jgi:16S rRNA (guanine527-N7)-methyltransferase
MPSELWTAISKHQAAFDLELSPESLTRLDSYYEVLLEHNPILHLIGPMDAEQFAIRHILESLTLLKHLPEKARFADIGSGGGLPAIPCLLVRGDLMAVLIEAKEKKANFLKLAVENLELAARTRIVARQFQEVDPANCSIITCRALDKFTEKLDRLLKWSLRRKVLLFGGPNLRQALQKAKVNFDETLMPMSEQRYLFVLRN